MILIGARIVRPENIRQQLALSHAVHVLQIMVVVMLQVLVWTAQPFQMRFMIRIRVDVYVTGDTQALLYIQTLMTQVWEALAQHVLLENTMLCWQDILNVPVVVLAQQAQLRLILPTTAFVMLVIMEFLVLRVLAYFPVPQTQCFCLIPRALKERQTALGIYITHSITQDVP